MKTFRVKSILRLLNLVLVFSLLSVEGWAWEERIYMRNGHEGDPDDSLDMVSGGSGLSADRDENIPNGVVSFDGHLFYIGEYHAQIYPEIRDGQIVWAFTVVKSRGDYK